MTNRSSRLKYHSGVAPPLRRNWRLLIGLAAAILGMLILLLSQSGLDAAPTSVSTPIIVRDGLVVRGTGPELYIFKKRALRQIISPTLVQQERAQQVSDSFLERYAHGEPVDPQGRPASLAAAESQPDQATSAASRTAFSSLWGLAGVITLAGSVWLVGQLFRRPQTDDSSSLDAALRQTAIYTAQIEQVLESAPPHQRRQLRERINRWRQTIEALTQNIARLRQNDLIRRDLARVPDAIADLERQLVAEAHSPLRAYLEQTLTQRKNQLAALEQLQTLNKGAEIQIETTTALLGTIYSQLLTGQSTSDVADYGRLLDEVDEEVLCLQDHLEALKEVKMAYSGFMTCSLNIIP